MDNKAEQLFLFGCKRNVTTLFKDFLMILEALESDHLESMGKLMDALPEDQKAKLILANHLTPEYMDRLRKRVLSNGNDCYRSIEATVGKLNIDFK
jgi:hypothetical protein